MMGDSAMQVTCRDCALPYERWPEGGCPNCGSGEPAGLPDGGGLTAATAGGPAVSNTEDEPPVFVTVDESDEQTLPQLDYGTWSLAELRNECAGRGLPTYGTKAGLVQRLTGGSR